MTTTNVNFQVKNGLELPSVNDLYIFGATSAPVTPFATFDFSRAKVLDPRITHTRTSSATGYNEFGKLVTYAANIPVFEHDSFTGESLGLLVEDSVTNQVIYSEQVDNAVWAKTEVSVSSTTQIAPDGTTSADNFVPSTNATPHFIEQIVSSTTNAVTLSVFVKVTSLVNKVTISPGGANRNAQFDLSTLVASSDSGVRSAKIKKLKNGWYRLIASYEASSTAYDRFRFFASSGFPASNGTASNGTNGILVWGFQFEQNSLATSYIQTVASTVTRGATQVSISGSNFSEIYRTSEDATIQILYNVSEDIDTTRVYLSLNNGTSSNSLNIQSTIPNQVSLVVTSAGTQVASQNVNDYGPGYLSNVVASYSTNYFNITNGGPSSTDISGTVPTFNRIDIGSLSYQSQTNCNTTIRRICLYPVAQGVVDSEFISR